MQQNNTQSAHKLPRYNWVLSHLTHSDRGDQNLELNLSKNQLRPVFMEVNKQKQSIALCISFNQSRNLEENSFLQNCFVKTVELACIKSCTVKRRMLFPKRLFIYIDKATAKGWGLTIWAVQMETPLTFRTWMDQCLHVSPFLEVRLNSRTLWKTQLFTFVVKNPTDLCPRAAILYLILNFGEKKNQQSSSKAS